MRRCEKCVNLALLVVAAVKVHLIVVCMNHTLQTGKHRRGQQRNGLRFEMFQLFREGDEGEIQRVNMC